eukprot:3661711-Prorocentrum_lima.AAC.1
MGSVENLAGPAELVPIFRPVELTLVPNHTDTFNEIANAMRHADHLCMLLEFQADTLKNTFVIRTALIQHLFTTVISLPLPRNHPKRGQCMWAQPI